MRCTGWGAQNTTNSFLGGRYFSFTSLVLGAEGESEGAEGEPNAIMVEGETGGKVVKVVETLSL